MTGNAMEEGLFRQLDNPSHTDPARTGFLAGATGGFLVAFGLSQKAILNTETFLAIWFAIGVPTAVVVTARLARRARKRKEKALIERRAEHEAESRRQIAAMYRDESRSPTKSEQ